MRLPTHDQQLLDRIFAYIHRAAREAVAPFTSGGKLNLGTPNAVGHVPPAAGGTGHGAGAEPPLGDPPALGYVLSSTTGGVRRWVPLLAGAGIAIAVDPATGAITIAAIDNIQYLTWGGDELTFGGDLVTWGAV